MENFVSNFDVLGVNIKVKDTAARQGVERVENALNEFKAETKQSLTDNLKEAKEFAAKNGAVSTANFNNDLFATIEYAHNNGINTVIMSTDISVDKVVFLYNHMVLDLGGHTLTSGVRRADNAHENYTAITNYNRFFKTGTGYHYLHGQTIDDDITIRNGTIINKGWDSGDSFDDWRPRGTISSTARKTTVENIVIEDNTTECHLWTAMSETVVKDSTLNVNRQDVGGSIWCYSYKDWTGSTPKNWVLTVDNCKLHSNVDETIYCNAPFEQHISNSRITNTRGHAITLAGSQVAYVENCEMAGLSFTDEDDPSGLGSVAYVNNCAMKGGTEYQAFHASPNAVVTPLVYANACTIECTVQWPMYIDIFGEGCTFKAKGEDAECTFWNNGYKYFTNCNFQTLAYFQRGPRTIMCSNCYFVNGVYMNQGAADNAVFTGCQFIQPMGIGDVGTRKNVLVSGCQFFGATSFKPQATKCVVFNGCTFANTPIGNGGYENIGCVQITNTGDISKITDSI